MGFDSLQHMRRQRSTLRGPKPARFVPSLGFGFPFDGFLPSTPCRLYFMPAALLGFTLRSFLLLEGSRAFPHEWAHLPFHPAVFPPSEDVGPAQRVAVPGLWPFRESLAIQQVFSPLIAGCSLGLFPSRACGPRPGPGFRRTPLARFARMAT